MIIDGDDRGEVGLHLSRDTDSDHHPAHLDEALTLIEKAYSSRVTPTEHPYYPTSLRHPTSRGSRSCGTS